MRRRRLIALALGMAGALLVFPLGSLGGMQAANTWSGVWGSSVAGGDMTLVQSGSAVTGTYPHDKGKINGTVVGNVLTGKWSEAPTYAGPGDAGPIKWTLSQTGSSFSGTWAYDGVKGGGGWSGTCDSGACTANRIQELVTKWKFSATGVNRIGSRITGRGAIVQTRRGSATSAKTAGTFTHVDEYFGDDEHLTLKVIGGRVLTDTNRFKDGDEMTLTVFVTHTDHPKACPAGAKGTLRIAEEDDDEHDPPEVLLRICGKEHKHNYVDTAKYDVKTQINRVG